MNCLIIAENDLKAREIYEDYRMYDQEVPLSGQGPDLLSGRCTWKSADKRPDEGGGCPLEKKGVTVITSIGGCMDYLLPLEVIKDHTLVFKSDSPVELGKLRKQLLGMGYEGNAQAEAPGQFSVRGGIIDIFP